MAAAREDYGLTPLEAASFGKPSAVLRAGGFLETVAEDTGVFFDRATPESIAVAVRLVLEEPPPPEIVRRHAELFAEDRFIQRLRNVVAEEIVR